MAQAGAGLGVGCGEGDARNGVTLGAGVGLKPEHYAEALAARAPGLWYEVHPENYAVAGGPRLAWLEAIRRDHPVSLHGVSLSIAGAAPIDAAALEALSALVRRFEPALVSEHLAWSRAGARYLPDLLPFPRSDEALDLVCAHVDAVQEALGRTIALENPAHYLVLDGHEYAEIDFLATIVRRTGCGLLLDINNVFVSARNLGLSAEDYLDVFPAEAVVEIHVAGHRPDPRLGDELLIDSHDAPVAAAVWALLRRFVARAGPRPTLLERDAALPPFDELLAERATAAALLADTSIDARSAAVLDARATARAPALASCRDVPMSSAARPPALADFQAAFVARLDAVEAPDDPQPGWAVYRNTVARAGIDALMASYPTVASLVGAAWFEECARAYLRREPPCDGVLAAYGTGFPAFLEAFAPARELPYLPFVAALDRCWTEAHLAADAPALGLDAFAGLTPERFAAGRLVPHPAARWARCDTAPAFSVWRRHREGLGLEDPLDWCGEAALVSRPRDAVRWVGIEDEAFAFLAACARGATVAAALEAAGGDAAAWWPGLVAAGAFTRLDEGALA